MKLEIPFSLLQIHYESTNYLAHSMFLSTVSLLPYEVFTAFKRQMAF
jgi:hypothetical protein